MRISSLSLVRFRVVRWVTLAGLLGAFGCDVVDGPEHARLSPHATPIAKSPPSQTPSQTPVASGGGLRIASMNFENFNDSKMRADSYDAQKLGGDGAKWIESDDVRARYYGARGPRALERLADAIVETDADVIGVQEMNSGPNIQQFVDLVHADTSGKGRRYEALIPTGGRADELTQRPGIVFDTHKLELLSGPIYVDAPAQVPSSRLLKHAAAVFRMKGGAHTVFGVVSVHLKAGAEESNTKIRLKQLERLKVAVVRRLQRGAFATDAVVILGDMNTVESNRPDQRSVYDHKFAELGWTDISDGLVCSSYYHDGQGTFLPTLLDHILVTGAMRRAFPDVSGLAAGGNCARFRCEPVAPTSHVADRRGVSVEERRAERRQFEKTFFDVSDHCPVVVNVESR